MLDSVFNEIREKLGTRRFVVPIIAALLIGTIFLIAIYPMTATSPKNLPFGIISLDEGTEFNDKEINMGNTIVGTITGTEDENSDESFNPSELAQEGTEKFVEGVGTLQDGLTALASAASTFSEGTAGVSTGANALAKGTNNLAQGAAGLSTGTSGLAAGTEQTQTMVSGYLSNIQSDLSSSISEAKTALAALKAIDLDALDLTNDERAQIESQISSLESQIASLENSQSTLSGNIALTTDALTNLSENANKVAEGASGLQKATDTLNPLAQNMASGTEKLAQGSSQLASALNGVAEGTGTLKEGAETLSDLISASLSSTSTSEDDENSGMSDTVKDAISWRVYDSQDSLIQAINNEELFVALVIPENFSQALLDSKMGEGDAAPLQLYFNEAKAPMLTNSIKPALTSFFSAQNIPYELISINPINNSGSLMPFAQMIGTMPVFMTAIIATVLLYFMTKAPVGSTRKDKLQVAGIRTVLIAVLSCIIGFGLSGALVLFGIEVPVVEFGLFMWFASACLILLFLGLVSFIPPLGALFILVTFAGGMTLATLPYEMLPDFYQDWIWPWAPQHFIGDGVRQILYTGAGAINSNSSALLTMGVIGLACLFLSALLPERKQK